MYLISLPLENTLSLETTCHKQPPPPPPPPATTLLTIRHNHISAGQNLPSSWVDAQLQMCFLGTRIMSLYLDFLICPWLNITFYDWETKKICVTYFIVIFTLLQWSGIESSISLRYAYTYVYTHLHGHIKILQGRVVQG